MRIPLPELAEQPLRFASRTEVRGLDDATTPEHALAGRITLGGPVGVAVNDSYVEDDANLRTFVQAEAARFAYHLVHLALTCNREPETPRLDKVTVALRLSSVGSVVAPLAWSMTPVRLVRTSTLTTSVKLGPSLKLADMEVGVGEIGQDRTEHREEVFLQAQNELGSDPRWELTRTKAVALPGMYRLVLVVRTERGYRTTIGGTIEATVRSGGIFRRGSAELPHPLTVSAEI